MVNEERDRLYMYFFAAAGITGITEGYIAHAYIFTYKKNALCLANDNIKFNER